MINHQATVTLIGNRTTCEGAAGRKLTKLSRLSELVILTERLLPYANGIPRMVQIMLYDASNGTPAHDYQIQQGHYNNVGLFEDIARHDVGPTVLFGDGHVERVHHGDINDLDVYWKR